MAWHQPWSECVEGICARLLKTTGAEIILKFKKKIEIQEKPYGGEGGGIPTPYFIRPSWDETNEQKD